MSHNESQVDVVSVDTGLDTLDLVISTDPNNWDVAEGVFPNIAFQVIECHTGFPAVFYGRVSPSETYDSTQYHRFLLSKLDRNFVLKSLHNAVGSFLRELNQEDGKTEAYIVKDESAYVSRTSHSIQNMQPTYVGHELLEDYRGAVTLFDYPVIEPKEMMGQINILPGVWVTHQPTLNGVGGASAVNRPMAACDHDDFRVKFGSEVTYQFHILPTIISKVSTKGHARGENLDWLTNAGLIDNEAFFEKVIDGILATNTHLSTDVEQAVVYQKGEEVYVKDLSEE